MRHPKDAECRNNVTSIHTYHTYGAGLWVGPSVGLRLGFNVGFWLGLRVGLSVTGLRLGDREGSCVVGCAVVGSTVVGS